MIRTWKTLALYSALVVAPVAAPAPVVAGGQDDAAKLQKQLEDLRKLLDTAVKSIDAAGKGIDGIKTDVTKLQKDIDTLKSQTLSTDIDLGKANTRIENLEKQLGNVQADVNFLKRELSKQVTTVNPALDKGSLDELKKHLVSIEQAILKLRPAEPTTSRVALSPPAPSTGRISLVNMYHEEMLFVINQKTHRVGPRSVIHIDAVPAGAVTYEVLSPTWGLREAKARNLSPNETFTLTVQ